MSWEKAQSLAVEVARCAVFADEFEKGGKYALHATGRVGVVLAKAAATGGLLAIVKDAPNALKKRLDDIAALLTKLKNADLASVLEKDLGNDELFNALQADNDLVKSWEVLHNSGKTKLKLTKAALEKVNDLLSDPKVQKALGANYADELAAICKAQGFSPRGGYRPKSLVSHLDDLKTFFTKFEGMENMAQMIRDMKNPNENVQDGLQHTLGQLNGLDASSVKRFDVEFDVEGFECPKTACRLDVEMNGTNPRFYEYKSFQDASRISINQFTSYLSRISSLSEMKYIFNASKLTTEQAKEGIRVLMSSPANKQNIFSVIWSNQGLKNTIFLNITDQNKAYAQFGNMLNDINNPIFNFIEIR